MVTILVALQLRLGSPHTTKLSGPLKYRLSTLQPCYAPPGYTSHVFLRRGWILAASTWIVVFAVQRMLWDAQKHFVQRRIAWLQQRPKPQSSTILATWLCCYGLKLLRSPTFHRATVTWRTRHDDSGQRGSDSKLKAYFERLFPNGTIENVYIATSHLIRGSEFSRSSTFRA